MQDQDPALVDLLFESSGDFGINSLAGLLRFELLVLHGHLCIPSLVALLSCSLFPGARTATTNCGAAQPLQLRRLPNGVGLVILAEEFYEEGDYLLLNGRLEVLLHLCCFSGGQVFEEFTD